ERRASSHPLTRDRQLERVVLAGLQREELRELIAAALHADAVDDAFAGSVHARTGGNAFLCEELLRALAEAGQIVVREHGIETLTALDDVAPHGVSEAGQGRVQRPSPPPRGPPARAAGAAPPHRPRPPRQPPPEDHV